MTGYGLWPQGTAEPDISELLGPSGDPAATMAEARVQLGLDQRPVLREPGPDVSGIRGELGI